MGKHQALLDGFVSINEIQLHWRIAEKTYIKEADSADHKDLSSSLVSLYMEVLKYQSRAICHLSKPQMSRAWSTSDSWTELAETIKGLSDDRLKAIPIIQSQKIEETWESQLRMMNESVSTLKEIRDRLDEEMRQSQQRYQDESEKALLHDLASTYQEDKNFNPERLEGTCEWLLQDTEFRKWRDTSEPSLFLAFAGPGCGKSVLSRCLIDENLTTTRVTTTSVCYFFFKENYADRDNSASAIAAILHQLFSSDSSGQLIRHGLGSHKTHGRKMTESFSTLWDILMLCAASPEAGEIICVLDALDECSRNYDKMMEELRKLYGTSRPAGGNKKLKFLITSRPYDYIESYFDDFDQLLSVRVDQKSTQIRQEIDLFIDKKVAALAKKVKIPDPTKISDRIKGTENRTYLWVTLIFKIIEEKQSLYSKMSRLEGLLSELPTQVSDTYERILSRSPDDKQTEIILQMIVAAARPLTLGEVNIALTLALSDSKGFGSYAALKDDLWPEDTIKSIVENLCGLFVSVHESKLHFIHQTAREFLLDPVPGERWKGRLNPEAAHSTMARICVGYLSLIDLSWIEDPLTLRKSSVNLQEHGFVDYACTYWPTHLKCIAFPSVTLRKTARRLCQTSKPRTDFWLIVWHDTVAPTKGSFWMKTPDLALASYFGLTTVVQDILGEPGVDVNAVSVYFGTALQAAVEGNHTMTAIELLKNGADGNLKGPVSHRAPLRVAARAGNTVIVKLLLSKKYGSIDINHRDHVLGTAFESALRGGHFEIAKLLLDSGDHVEVSDDTLTMAISGPKACEVIHFLREHRPNVINVTQDVVNLASRLANSDRLMSALLENRVNPVKDLTPDICEGFGLDFVQKYIDDEKVIIDECIMVAAANNYACGAELTAWLLDRGGLEVPVTEKVLQAAAINFYYGADIMSVLKEKRPSEVKLSPAVRRMAKMNTMTGKAILEILSEDTQDSATS